MAKQVIKIDGIRCVFTKEVVTIKKSRRIEYEDIPEFCKKLKEQLPYAYKRTTHSWVKEVIAHNFLYDLDLFTAHTEDTDLEEHEKLHRLVSYEFLYIAHAAYGAIQKLKTILD